MKTEEEMLKAMARYCSQAERCIYDVQKKIRAAELPAGAAKRITDRLLQENFLDEARYCRSFVRDKFRFNRWGRIKICYELRMKGIKPEAYREAVEAIDEEEYENALADLLREKKRSVKGRSPQDAYMKLLRFASSRGFETPLIVAALKAILKNTDYDTPI